MFAARHARLGRRHRDAGKSSCDEHIRCCIDSPEADIVALISAFLRLVSIVWRTLKGVFSKSNPLNIGILHYSSCYRSGSMDPQRLWASSTFTSRYRGHFFKVDTITITIPSDFGDHFCQLRFTNSLPSWSLFHPASAIILHIIYVSNLFGGPARGRAPYLP